MNKNMFNNRICLEEVCKKKKRTTRKAKGCKSGLNVVSASGAKVSSGSYSFGCRHSKARVSRSGPAVREHSVCHILLVMKHNLSCDSTVLSRYSINGKVI